MSGDWRSWAITLSALIAVAGLALWATTGIPTLAIVGVIALVTSLLERTYGTPKAHPAADMHPTGERFVDPETGRLITVWLDSGTGERRYVAEPDPPS